MPVLPSAPVYLAATVSMGATDFVSLLPANAALVWSAFLLAEDGSEGGPDMGAAVQAGVGSLRGIVPPHVLQPGSRYRFIARVEAAWPGTTLNGSAFIDVAVMACPSGGTVFVTPSSGTAGITRCEPAF